jgi:hypothetical protein
MASPTVVTGNESTYTGAVDVIRQLDAAIDNTDPKDYPLLKAVGLNSYSEPIVNTKFEWQMDHLNPVTDALNGAVSGTAETQITVDHAEYFAIHDVIMVESELMRVEAIDISSDILTVERGFAGSTAATHSDNDVVYRMGAARPEGSSPGWAQQVAMVQPYNYTQIFDAVAGITGTEEAEKNYAPDDLMAYRIGKRMEELFMMMERALLYGRRNEPATNTGRTTGGLVEFVTDENDLSAAALEFADLEDAMEDVFKRAGLSNVPDTLWCNAWAKRKITSWGVSTIRTGRGESVYGNQITVLETNFGSVSINLDHLIKEGELWLLDIDRVQCGPLSGRGFMEIDATPPGDDLKRSRILGEYGYAVKGEDGSNDGVHVRVKNFSTSS